MEPRERLKRYLEQRRELGERELVLDGMTVEDVMRIVGAMGGSGAPVPSRKDAPGVPATPVPAESRGSSEEVAAKTVAPTADLRPKRDDPPATTDWREALRASGVESASAEGKARKPAMQASAPKSSAPQSPAPPSPAPPITAGAGASEKPVSKRYEFPRPDDAPSAPSAGSAVA